MAEHPEVAVTTVVEVHCAGRQALAARGRALDDWMRTVLGVAYLARQAGVQVQISEAAAFAIILTAEAYVHEYARAGRLEQVVEKTGDVQQLARALFAADPTSTEPGRLRRPARRTSSRGTRRCPRNRPRDRSRTA